MDERRKEEYVAPVIQQQDDIEEITGDDDHIVSGFDGIPV